MSLDDIEVALKSLDGWNKVVGCMGGEPTTHPDFIEICKLYQRYFPRRQCGLWTSGGPAFNQNRELIAQTFGVMLYNDHSEVGKHHPWGIAIDEVIDDEQLRDTLIDNCWVQKLWSPSINPNGAFFCEIAAVFDLLFGIGGGYSIEKDWWKRDVKEFMDQRGLYCGLCSMAIPYGHIPNNNRWEWVSAGNARRLEGINSPWADRLQVIDEKLTLDDIKGNLKDYAPWEYLGKNGVRDKRGIAKGGYAKKRHHTPLPAQQTRRAVG